MSETIGLTTRSGLTFTADGKGLIAGGMDQYDPNSAGIESASMPELRTFAASVSAWSISGLWLFSQVSAFTRVGGFARP